jgi:hypothetical protein
LLLQLLLLGGLGLSPAVLVVCFHWWSAGRSRNGLHARGVMGMNLVQDTALVCWVFLLGKLGKDVDSLPLHCDEHASH